MTVDDLARLVGERLRAARRERALSLGALAAAAGIGKGSLSEIENGVRNPTLSTLYALAGTLGVPLATLLADRTGARISSPGIEARLLDVSRDDGATVEVYRLRLEPGACHQSVAHGPGVTEHLLVTAPGAGRPPGRGDRDRPGRGRSVGERRRPRLRRGRDRAGGVGPGHPVPHGITVRRAEPSRARWRYAHRTPTGRTRLELPPPMQLPPGLTLPFPWVRVWPGRAFVSGHGPLQPDGSLTPIAGQGRPRRHRGQAYAAARLTALAILASLQRALGDLDRVTGWLRVFGMVNAAPGYTRTPAVINGFSDLILDLWGPDARPHARSAIGVAELPFNLPVEIEAEVAVN